MPEGEARRMKKEEQWPCYGSSGWKRRHSTYILYRKWTGRNGSYDTTVYHSMQLWDTALAVYM
jgi:hypothetical protein